jgi:hypothetical protein
MDITLEQATKGFRLYSEAAGRSEKTYTWKERYIYFGKPTKRDLWRYISLARPEPAPNTDNLSLKTANI